MPGTPATTPNLAIPRYAGTDPADFALQYNAGVDRIDTVVAVPVVTTLPTTGLFDGKAVFYKPPIQGSAPLTSQPVWHCVRVGSEWLLAAARPYSFGARNGQGYASDIGTTWTAMSGTTGCTIPNTGLWEIRFAAAWYPSGGPAPLTSARALCGVSRNNADPAPGGLDGEYVIWDYPPYSYAAGSPQPVERSQRLVISCTAGEVLRIKICANSPAGRLVAASLMQFDLTPLKF